MIERTFNILHVDDEQNLREGAKRILARMGHNVLQATNGEEALKLLPAREVDIVLLDLKMPGMDGMEVLKQIRASYPHILVIIATGFATIETAIEAMKLGAYDFMTKPFRPDQLRLITGRAMEHLLLKEERDRLSEERDRGLWDITKEKSRLRTVVDSIVAGILITDMNKRIVMCNPAFYRMMQVGPEGITGENLVELPTLKEIDGMMNDLTKGSHQNNQEITREIVRPGDRPTFVRVSVNRVMTETGKTMGLVAITRDITRIKEQEKEKSAFVAMLTHELRSPLSSVDTQLHVVLKGLTGGLTDRQREMFERIRTRVKNVLYRINDLLDLSKIEARQFTQEKSPANLGPIIKESMELLSDQASEKNLSFESELDSALPDVLGDPSSLKDAAVNLIGNAIRYTPAGGRIAVSTGVEGDLIFFRVADSGIGIAEEHKDKIFDRFFRVKDPRIGDVVGTGLGLPIVKTIVEDHNGTITVESEHGGGSVFTVRLPVLK